jgi:hypothetical protein
MLRRVLIASSAFVLMASVSTFVFAQKGKSSAPKGTAVTVDATIEQVVPQGIIANDKAGKKYAIGFDQKSKVGLSGDAGVDYIANGMFVQFDVDLDAEGKPTSDAKKLLIVEQTNINVPGVFSSKGPDGKPGEPGPYFVRGTVRGNKDGMLTIVAGNKPMTVKVADGTKVPVKVSDWTMAKAGDTIKGSGTAFAQPGAPMTIVLGVQMEITSAGPIGKGKR